MEEENLIWVACSSVYHRRRSLGWRVVRLSCHSCGVWLRFNMLTSLCLFLDEARVYTERSGQRVDRYSSWEYEVQAMGQRAAEMVDTTGDISRCNAREELRDIAHT